MARSDNDTKEVEARRQRIRNHAARIFELVVSRLDEDISIETARFSEEELYLAAKYAYNASTIFESFTSAEEEPK